MLHPDEEAIRQLREEHARHQSELCQLDMSLCDDFKTECDRHAARVGRIYYEFMSRELQHVRSGTVG